jgi:acyl transferase domain-containing protein
MSSAAVEAASPSLSPADTWDSEVFILCGADRRQLLSRVQELNAWLETHPDVALKDLAYTLNRAQSGNSRIALVAGTVADLQKRLTRAAQRLADPECRQVKDVTGIYYFEQPLAPHGRLAVLFPGEGAQYLNMQDGRSLTDTVFVPRDASPEERALAERELGELGNAIASVLMADSAFHSLLERLGVRPDAVAGHSAGELSALWAAGCFADEVVGSSTSAP